MLLVLAVLALLVVSLAPAPAAGAQPAAAAAEAGAVEDSGESDLVWDRRESNAWVHGDMGFSPDGATMYVPGWQVDGPGWVVRAYDAFTGDTRWRTPSAAPVAPEGDVSQELFPMGLEVSPDGATVYVAGTWEINEYPDEYRLAIVIAYDAATGQERWRAVHESADKNAQRNPFNIGNMDMGMSPDGAAVYITASSFEGRKHPTEGHDVDDYLTIAYDAETGEQRWMERFWLSDEPCGLGSGRQFAGAGLAVNPDTGTVYVSGQVGQPAPPEGQPELPTGCPEPPEGSVLEGYAMVAYDPATGEKQWVSVFEAAVDQGIWSNRLAGDLGVSPDGSTLYLNAASKEPGDYCDSGTEQIRGWLRQKFATVAFDAGTGEQRWVARSEPEGSCMNYPRAFDVSADGATVYVTGTSYRYLDNSIDSEVSSATVAYDAVTGEQRWTSVFKDGNYAGPSAMEASPDGATVWVANRVSDHNGADPVKNPYGAYDFFTVGYDTATGQQVWGARYDHPGGYGQGDMPYVLAVHPSSGMVYVAGSSGSSSSEAYGGVTLAYQPSGDSMVRFTGGEAPSGVRGSTVELAAQLTLGRAASVAGKKLRFTVGDFEAEATTDDKGVATVEMPVEQSYGTHELTVAFAGDEAANLPAAKDTATFRVSWEHTFTEDDWQVRINTITNELQFAAPGDVSGVKHDPGMTVETLPTAGKVISINYSDEDNEDLTVVGEFFPNSPGGLFAATVRTPAGVYVLKR